MIFWKSILSCNSRDVMMSQWDRAPLKRNFDLCSLIFFKPGIQMMKAGMFLKIVGKGQD